MRVVTESTFCIWCGYSDAPESIDGRGWCVRPVGGGAGVCLKCRKRAPKVNPMPVAGGDGAGDEELPDDPGGVYTVEIEEAVARSIVSAILAGLDYGRPPRDILDECLRFVEEIMVFFPKWARKKARALIQHIRDKHGVESPDEKGDDEDEKEKTA